MLHHVGNNTALSLFEQKESGTNSVNADTRKLLTQTKIQQIRTLHQTVKKVRF